MFHFTIFQATSDLTIIAEGKEIFVHREILSSRSNYFQVFLQEHWTEKNRKYVRFVLSQIYSKNLLIICFVVFFPPLLILNYT